MNPIQFLAHQMMIPILNSFYELTHSYGLAIILLTLTIKAALFPLTAKQFKASRQMQQLQPKLVELQQKYKDKPEELQIKMMEFYKEHNANPFSSCLPMIIQLPFLFALYSALGNKEFQAQIANKGFLFIQNLAGVGVLPGHGHGLMWDNLILVIFFGVTTFLTQKMMTTNPDDPMQKQMLTMMPIMMTVMFLFFPLPSGILLYIAISNLFTIAQNYFLVRSNPALATAGPVVPASKAVIDTTPTVVDEDASKKPGKKGS
ncbi:MAG TPA: YidC/Oxa1 family membrane protein insertase [Stenomitos sp.]